MLKLFSYDHCPYCVKARMIFGYKDVPFSLITMQNDDVELPTSMVGQKIVPILQKEDGSFMPESMDIVKYIDENYGDGKVISDISRDDVAQWLNECRSFMYALCMPRWVQAPLEEFTSKGAREFFIQKKEGMIGSFEGNLKQSKELIAEAENHLAKLEGLIQDSDAVNGELSEQDFHLFGYLRGLTIVKDLNFPAKVVSYMQNISSNTQIPLFTGVAV